jgi:FKBP-type peptidyl-prolyl cis-trans isomerase (trigger factor)
MLIDQEVNRMLSKLLDQINKLGLDIDEYLSSIGKNKDNIRTEYSQTANETLKLEFILQAVVEDLKIQVGDNEIDALIATVPDPKAKANFANPMERANLKAILGRRKAIEHLEKLLA